MPAGCVFWMQASIETFATTKADHANCSVGSYTHGFLPLEEATAPDDVGAVLDSGWVDEPAVVALPVVAERPGSVVYGPLADATIQPDVVLLRVTGLGLMTLNDAVPGMQFEASRSATSWPWRKSRTRWPRASAARLAEPAPGWRPRS